MTRERDPATICRNMAALAKETLEQWTSRTQAEFEERTKKAKEESDGRANGER